MLKRLKSYNEFVGNEKIVNKIKKDIQDGTLKDFIILYGNEGVGKTSLANLIAINLVLPTETELNKYIDSNKEIEGIQYLRMSLDSSLDNVKTIVEDIKGSISSTKVFILDEAQDMSIQCQDALLTDLEYITTKNVILCTTNLSRIAKTLQSRAYVINLKDPMPAEMAKLIKKEIKSRNLRIEQEDLFVNILINTFKRPRACLNVIDAIGKDKEVLTIDFDLYINYEDISNYKNFLKELEGNIHLGILAAQNIESLEQLINFTEACVTSKVFNTSVYKQLDIHDVVSKVNENKLLVFYKKLIEVQNPTNHKNLIVNAFIEAHGKLKKTNTVTDEIQFMSKYGKPEETTSNAAKNIRESGIPADLSSIIGGLLPIEEGGDD